MKWWRLIAIRRGVVIRRRKHIGQIDRKYQFCYTVFTELDNTRRSEMNERIKELAAEAEDYADSIVDQGGEFHLTYTKKFAELLIRECINTLEFHGFDDAVPYIKWMATNKLGVKE